MQCALVLLLWWISWGNALLIRQHRESGALAVSVVRSAEIPTLVNVDACSWEFPSYVSALSGNGCKVMMSASGGVTLLVMVESGGALRVDGAWTTNQTGAYIVASDAGPSRFVRVFALEEPEQDIARFEREQEWMLSVETDDLSWVLGVQRPGVNALDVFYVSDSCSKRRIDSSDIPPDYLSITLSMSQDRGWVAGSAPSPWDVSWATWTSHAHTVDLEIPYTWLFACSAASDWYAREHNATINVEFADYPSDPPVFATVYRHVEDIRELPGSVRQKWHRSPIMRSL